MLAGGAAGALGRLLVKASLVIEPWLTRNRGQPVQDANVGFMAEQRPGKRWVRVAGHIADVSQRGPSDRRDAQGLRCSAAIPAWKIESPAVRAMSRDGVGVHMDHYLICSWAPQTRLIRWE